MEHRSFTTMREGYLTKKPLRPGMFSSARRRYFVLTDHVLEWSEDRGLPIKGTMPLNGAMTERTGEALVLIRKGEKLILSGEDLDGWNAAIQRAIDRTRLRDVGAKEIVQAAEGRAELAELATATQDARGELAAVAAGKAAAETKVKELDSWSRSSAQHGHRGPEGTYPFSPMAPSRVDLPFSTPKAALAAGAIRVAELPPRNCCDHPTGEGEPALFFTVWGTLLLDYFSSECVDAALLLSSKRALACTCFDLRSILYEHLHGTTLRVMPLDATWSNALYVARLPNLETLRVEGERCPRWNAALAQLSKCRGYAKLSVGTLGAPTAVFVAAIIGNSDCTIRLSDGNSTRALAAFRSKPSVCLPPKGSTDADFLIFFGALSLNPHARDAVDSMLRPTVSGRPGVLAVWSPGVLAVWSALLRHEATFSREQLLLWLAHPDTSSDDIRDGYLIWPWLDDYDIAMAAVQISPCALQCAPETIRSERDIVLAAVDFDRGHPRWTTLRDRRHCAKALEWASPALQGDREVAAAALRSNGYAFRYLSDDLQCDRSMVLAAVSSCGEVLGWAPTYLRDDPEVVLAAVRFNGQALEFASNRLTEDRGIAFTAVSQLPEAYAFVGPMLAVDRSFALDVVRANPSALRCLPSAFQTDRQVALAAVAQSAGALRIVSEGLRYDREFVLDAVRVRGGSLGSCCSEHRIDKEIVLAAVGQDGRALQYAYEQTRADVEVVTVAVTSLMALDPPCAPLALQFASEALRTNLDLINLAGGTPALLQWQRLCGTETHPACLAAPALAAGELLGPYRGNLPLL